MELEKATDIRPLSRSAGKSEAFFPHWRAASASNNNRYVLKIMLGTFGTHLLKEKEKVVW
jgi:hypothetical protein